MTGLSRCDFYMRDWLSGTRGLSAAARGVYIDLLCVMYDTGKPVPNDKKYLCRLLGFRDYRGLDKPLNELIDAGKINVTSSGITNQRAEIEIAKAQKLINGGRASHGGGRPPKNENHPKSISKTRPERVLGRPRTETHDTCIDENQHFNKQPPSPSPSIKKEEGANAPASRYEFEGQCGRITHEHLAGWRRSYPNVQDHLAALQACDDYYAAHGLKGRKFFFLASAWLKREHERDIKPQEQPTGPRWEDCDMDGPINLSAGARE